MLLLISGPAVADDYYEKGEKAYRSGQYEEALDWFRKSAQAGYGQGQLIYGHMLYSNGQAPLENKTEALKWFRLAGEQGNPVAQYMVGYFYEHGKVVEQNYRSAIEWYIKAANQGYVDAANNLGKIYDAVATSMSDKSEAKVYYEEAVYWYRQAAERGQPQSQANLGLMYFNGTGVEKDDKKAVKWWQLAANQGNVRAMFNLGVAYVNGTGVSRDLVEAYAWIFLANGDTGFDFSGEQVTVDYSETLTQLEGMLGDSSIAKARSRAKEIHAQIVQ